MEEQNIFELIHNMDNFTNKLIIQWNKSFNEDLGISHVLVLSHLHHNGKSRPSDIAKILGLSPPTLSYLADKMVAKELVVRTVDEVDRRIIYLNITDKGTEILERAIVEGQKLRKNLFQKLNEEDRAQLLRIFEKMSQED
ncbi:hypothetical protein PAECIP112173_02780 [Paenibacillus sp. JJ-100]|uniref:MarR family winged helix-turn-helix transcriptional regulator n=1 Tax=Paenibacillus sp. JJ-100 TaxID=2974896 RepID=UPI0022FF68E8|nr:MarR family transcriptional regulator [Paenibacillus sp. JJ-100]CAI6080080.1 hypothetical protein PAECIP112173_02780 [Paenibacillus sp. JJ-100]